MNDLKKMAKLIPVQCSEISSKAWKIFDAVIREHQSYGKRVSEV
jgi:hypothetical protein